MNNQCSIYFLKISSVLGLKHEEVFDSQEILRFNAMTSEKRKHEFLASRFLIKSILKEFYKMKDPKVSETIHGKPFVRGIKFNISHSGKIIVLAVHLTAEVGIDIEDKKEKKFYLEIAEQYFHPKECKYILAVTKPSQQLKRFKVLWALKEAYIKATGGVVNKKTIRIYIDLAERKIISVPTKKEFQFLYDSKNNITCVIQEKYSNHQSPTIYNVRILKNKISRVKKSRITFSSLTWD